MSASDFRLSPQQRDLWAESEDVHGHTRVVGLYACPPAIDGARVAQAVESVLSRFEILRTTVTAVNGAPVQRIATPSDLSFSPSELPDLQDASAADVVAAVRAQPSAQPIIALLVPRAETQPWLALSASPLSADALSLDRIAQMIFRAAVGATATSGDDEDLQYADLTEFLWSLFEEEEASAALRDWRRDAAAPMFDVDLATGSGPFSPGVMAVKGRLPGSILEAASGSDVSVEALMLAAWGVLLHRLTRQPAGLVGVEVDGRGFEELEDAIGPLARLVPVAISVPADDRFADFVQSLKASLQTARERQEYFTRELLTAPNPQHFRAAFGYCSQSEDDRRIQEAPRSFCERFDLALRVKQAGQAVVLELHFDRGRFSEDVALRIVDHLQALLAAVGRTRDERISALDALTPAQVHRLVHDLNPKPRSVDETKTVIDLFEACQARTPDAPAVIAHDGTLTYAQLEAESNRLARALQNEGIEPGAFVGLSVERGTQMAVGILGIVKAGAAYVPIDPLYPEARRSFIETDSKAELIVVAGPGNASHARLLDLDSAEVRGQSSAPIPRSAGPEDPAYVIYTSGSTGRPKGVVVRHRNLAHSTIVREDFYPAAPRRFLLLSSFAFDSSIVGIFWPLCTGGAIVLPRSGDEKELHRLAELIAREKVDTTLALPSLVRLLLEESKPSLLASLRNVIVAGEACALNLIALHRRVLPDAGLYNEYGPTEATVWTTAFRCDTIADDMTSVPIGKPISNARVYLFDDHSKLAPEGVPGRLFVGGPGVALGYLDRPELTAERFIDNPIDPEVTPRLYDTGDLARHLPSGDLQFLGRADNQIKIRGFRVELEEIERAIGAHPAVRAAAVITRVDGALETELNRLEAPTALRLLDEVESLTEPQVEEALRVERQIAH